MGNNFQEHVITAVGYELTPGDLTNDAIWIPEVTAAAQQALAETQAGRLTAVSSCQGFFPYKQFAMEEEPKEAVEGIQETANKSSRFQKKQLEQVISHLENPKSANIQLLLFAVEGNFEEGAKDQSKLFRKAEKPGEKMLIALVVGVQYPAFRGSVHITSAGKFSLTLFAGSITAP